jgi:F-type H+-transporting ATPase subunit delta
VSTQAQPKDYAAAIYDLALEAWTRQLGSIQATLRQNAALRTALDDPGRSTKDKLEELGRSVPGGLDDPVRKFLGTLLEAGQLDQLDAILVEFQQLASRRPERKIAQVTTAVPLTAAEEETLRASLAERFGSDLEFEFKVDEALLGGVHLRVGDQVIDGSVAGKLASLRDRLAA